MAERRDDVLLLADELSALRQVGIEKTFATGDRLVSMGARSREVFYLVGGKVKIVAVDEMGTESVFGVRTPGVFIGEMSTLIHERRSADVVAIEPTTAVMVGADRFIEFLERYPAVALALLRVQTRRLNEMTVRSMLGARSVKARVAQRLLELAAADEAGAVVELTQTELAQYVDASREWTSKALGELRRDGAIATARGRVTILDTDALQLALLDR